MGDKQGGAGRKGRLQGTGIRRQQGEAYTTYAFNVAGHKGELRVTNESPGNWSRNVTFLVNGSVDRPANLSVEAGRALLLKAIQAWRVEVKRAPNGTIWGGIASDADGGGLRRARFYRSLGFSEPDGNDTQLAIKRNGQAVPFGWL